MNNILLDQNPYKNVLVHNISYKNLINSKPLRFRLDKIDGFVRVYDGTRYLPLFGSEKYDSVYNRIRCLISVDIGITYITSLNHAKIKLDSYDPLPPEKATFFDNVIILKWSTILGY